MTTIATWMLRFFLVLALFTCLGQIPYKGRSLEMRYHRFVNSERFQNLFWTTMRPLTWTGEKVAYLYDRVRTRDLRDAAIEAR